MLVNRKELKYYRLEIVYVEKYLSVKKYIFPLTDGVSFIGQITGKPPPSSGLNRKCDYITMNSIVKYD